MFDYQNGKEFSMIEKLSQEESQKLLSEQFVARLGCVLEGGEPYVVPVNYLFKDGFIFIHSLLGLKIEALRAIHKLAFRSMTSRVFSSGEARSRSVSLKKSRMPLNVKNFGVKC